MGVVIFIVRNKKSLKYRVDQCILLVCVEYHARYVYYMYNLVTIFLVLMVNTHFLNYYILSCAYARVPPFNHLDLTYPESNYPHIIAHNFNLSSFLGRGT